MLEWVACPLSRGSSQPRNQSRVSCIAGGFFTNWADIREAQLLPNSLSNSLLWALQMHQSLWHLLPLQIRPCFLEHVSPPSPKVNSSLPIMIFFNWSIIALQYCVHFCCTMKWINSIYKYIPSLLNLPTTHLQSLHSRSSQSTKLSSLCYSRVPLAVYFTHGSVCMRNVYTVYNLNLPICSTPSLFPHVHAPDLHFYSCPGYRFLCTTFVDFTYMC